MTGPRKPDHETLLLWMSALLDGELGPDEEAQLFAACEADPDLADELTAMSAARIPAAALSPDDAASLTASILAATAPAQTPMTADGARQLASAALDDEAPTPAWDRLQKTLQQVPSLAGEIASFAAAARATGHASRAIADLPQTHAFLAPVPAAVAASVQAAQDRAIAAMAWGDAESDQAPSADDAVAFLPLSQVLQAPAASPWAAKAGAAALQAISAIEAAARPAPARAAGAPAAPAGFFARLRAALSAGGVPLGFAAAAAVAFLVGRDPGGPAPPQGEDWRAALLAAATKVVDDVPPGPPVDLPVIADNDATVEALESETATAVVFNTEASNITIIWVPEADEGEMGT